jgi:hypothetical protein
MEYFLEEKIELFQFVFSLSIFERRVKKIKKSKKNKKIS